MSFGSLFHIPAFTSTNPNLSYFIIANSVVITDGAVVRSLNRLRSYYMVQIHTIFEKG